jgi:hypothetical protein
VEPVSRSEFVKKLLIAYMCWFAVLGTGDSMATRTLMGVKLGRRAHESMLERIVADVYQVQGQVTEERMDSWKWNPNAHGSHFAGRLGSLRIGVGGVRRCFTHMHRLEFRDECRSSAGELTVIPARGGLSGV